MAENLERTISVGPPLGQARVLIVEDEAEISDLIEERLTENGFIVRSASDVDEAETLLRDFEPHIIIADLRLKNEKLGGLKVADMGKARGIKSVLISGSADLDSMKEAIRHGITQYFDKPFVIEDILAGVKQLIETREDGFENVAKRHQFTKREKQVLRLLAKGLSNREIASEIQTSERTVKAHVSSMLLKSKAASRLELLSRLI